MADRPSQNRLITRTQQSGYLSSKLNAQDVNEDAQVLDSHADDIETNAAALANKVDKVTGKGLSTNDYTTAEKSKVTNLPADTTAELLAKADEERTSFALGYKADLLDGKVPAVQLPSYVDDVVEYANLAAFPVTGESGKIYLALDSGITYRWSGSTYVALGSGLALGETSVTAYRGDRGKTAYDHSQVAHNKTLVGLSNVDNTSDINKPISTATQAAIDLKLDIANFTAAGIGLGNVENKSSATIRGEIVEGDIPVELARVANVTINSYSSTALLYADQASQNTGVLYRISDGLNDYWVEYLGTTNGDETDYLGWPKALATISWVLDTTSTGEKASWVNTGNTKTILKVKVQVSSDPVDDDLVIDIQKNGSSIFSSKPTVYAGEVIATTGVITDNTLLNLDELSVILESINSAENPQVEIEMEYDDIKTAYQEDLNKPVIGTTSSTEDSITVPWTGDVNAESHTAEFHNGDNNWASVPGYAGAASTFTHSGLTAGTYYYRIQSIATGKNTSAYATTSVTVSSITYAVNDDYIALQPFTPYTYGSIPTGYATGGTHNATNYFDEDAGGLRVVSDGTSTQIYKSGVLTSGQTYNYEIKVSSHTSGSVKIENSSFGTAILLNGVGTFTGTASFGTYTRLVIARLTACDMVIEYIKLWE